jgi:RNA-dependent RNA polymerase
MLVKRTRHSTSRGRVKMVLNLYRREIDIRFPSVYSDKTREYKFIIPIDQVFDLFQSQSPYETKTSFILTLRTPPHFYKKLSDGIVSTHDDAAFNWREQDAWLRQTNILGHEHEVGQLKSRPVTLKNHPEGIVNIGRWTTYRITIDDTAIDKEKYRVFRAALRDYNVQIAGVQDFQLTHEGDPAWELLDLSLTEYESTSPSSAFRNAFEHSLEGLLGSKKNQIYLPFPVRYQLEVCISNGWINEHNVTREFLGTLSTIDHDRAKHVLESVALNRLRVFNPMDIFTLRVPRLPSMKGKIPDNCFLIRSVIVTPSAMILNTPYVEMTNRVIRRYKEHSDRFLRVRFEDDEMRGYARINATSQKTMDEVLSKVFRTLTSGIVIGDRHYEFLAFGNSQLREHGAYFFAPLSTGPTASHIRAWMGRFEHEKIVAKHAARIGQCFSTTRAIRNAGFPPVRESDLINNVERNNCNFTDGVGKISRFYAETIAKELGFRGNTPSVYQFRMAGCKGVLAIAPELGATNVKIRRSQFKFETTYSGMEIIRWSEYWVATLNRQLITVLSAIGVPDDIFLLMQEREIELMERAMIEDKAAMEALTRRVDPNRMTLTIAGLVQAGFRGAKEPFVTSLLGLWRAWSIKYLKEKARLPVPEGAFILGCTDETGTLRGHFNADRIDQGEKLEHKMAKLPEVFVQITCPDSGQRKVIEGVCFIARNPSLHPGDIRVVKAVDVTALHHLVDVLVLPQTGDRDLSSMCSGGDLDGDDYVVIWDKRLLPKIWNEEPMDYTAPKPKELDRDVTQTDITRFFVKYMKNDFLPKIALSHLAWADYLDEGIRHGKCLELARLHSKAVDYPKTGQPAQMQRALNAKEWPHFMEKKGRKSYTSRKVLGQLYDAVDRVAFVPKYDAPFDGRILNVCDPDDEIMRAARELKHEYDTSLQRIMAQHDIKTEFEVWSTFVLDHSKASKDYKFHEEIGQLSNSLKEQYYNSVVDKAGGKNWSHLVPWAVAMYRVTREELEAAKAQGKDATMPFISFPWILRSTLTQIVKDVDNSTTRKQSGDNGDLSGSLQQPAFNPETQMYDDPYQAAVEEAGEGDPLNQGLSATKGGTPPKEKINSESTSLLDTDSPTHSDPHNIGNDRSPPGSYPADLKMSPQPTAEQFTLVEKIIRPSQSSDSSRRVGSDSSMAPENISRRMSAMEELAANFAECSLVDAAQPTLQSGLGFSRSGNGSEQSSCEDSGRLVHQSSAPKEFSKSLAANHKLNSSKQTSSTGSGVLVDVPELDLQESTDRPMDHSLSSLLDEELAGLGLESAAPEPALLNQLENLEGEKRRYTSSSIPKRKADSNSSSPVDDPLTGSDELFEDAMKVLQEATAPLPQKRANAEAQIGGTEGQGRSHNSESDNLMGNLDVARDEQGEDEDEEEDEDTVLMDPLGSSGQADAERLMRLAGM